MPIPPKSNSSKIPSAPPQNPAEQGGWRFRIDRGGTFTDIVAQTPTGEIVTHKLLSENPERYSDAVLHGIRHVLRTAEDRGQNAEEEAPHHEDRRDSACAVPVRIDSIRMGTTVATNALLERKGEPTVLVITEGFGDALRIGYQERPDIFAHEIILPSLLHERVIEARERCDAEGNILIPLDIPAVRSRLQAAFDAGIRAVAVVFMHGYRYPAHERAVAQVAREIGYEQISVSHEVSPLIKLVGRGDTTVVDAYLSPVLRRYVEGIGERVRNEIRDGTLGDGGGEGGPRFLLMQSNGGLTDARRFRGRDSILSGPAGGVVGAVATARRAGFHRIIGFDMGGTSTDVSHYAGALERAFDTKVAGVRLRVPILRIHTIAAGGGSIARFRDGRYQVGPASAGADPGPACYRRGGPLTVTDCNVMTGRIHPRFFPAVFGPDGNLPIDTAVVRERFDALAHLIGKTTGQIPQPEEIADGFLRIAVENMANAIKKISVQRGYNVTGYTLCAFGAAGGQHACPVAEALGMERILIHAHAGVLSAYGMGLAQVRALREKTIGVRLAPEVHGLLASTFETLAESARAELQDQGIEPANIKIRETVHLQYAGTDASLPVPFASIPSMTKTFQKAHRDAYGFLMPNTEYRVEMVSLEAAGYDAASRDDGSPLPGAEGTETVLPESGPPRPLTQTELNTRDGRIPAPVYRRSELFPGCRLPGPALIVEANATTVIEPGWRGLVTREGDLLLTFGSSGQARAWPRPLETPSLASPGPDPVMLEVFNNLYMSIAEQMGAALVNTAYSVNIKERLDFSCALFDERGYLVANAPHIPVHLGSMGESVRAILRARAGSLKPGDVLALNNPCNGGTHLPDITVITPVFESSITEDTEDRGPNEKVLFFVASRGHHADVGGIAPGSMPPDSRHIREEGILVDDFLLVEQGRFREKALRALLAGTDSPGVGQGHSRLPRTVPARNPDQNVADLKAQIAANEKGLSEIRRMARQYGLSKIREYMGHIQDNAEAAVRGLLAKLPGGTFQHKFDFGARIAVTITVDRPHERATIDFAGTSPQQPGNFNAPLAVCRAVVLYVFRTLLEEPIPLNEGCLRPLDIRVPPGSMLNPDGSAAVAAGNVEVAQAIADALFGALGIMASSQGTMNNFTFGNEQYQYYETICGGTGAGRGLHGEGFHGACAVHAHMTNSRLTDPEVLEQRFPVLVERFAIRRSSGGEGHFRGGDGVIRRIRFLEPMSAAILSNHRRVAPFGLAGGGNGKTGRNSVERAGGGREKLAGTEETLMNPGDVFIIETPGGGGYAPRSLSDLGRFCCGKAPD